MPRHHHTLLRIVAWGALSLALGIVWRSLGEGDAQMWSLHQLSHEGGVLMSCAEDAQSLSEPLWCSDPDSPQCSPAAPDAPPPDLTHGPLATLPPTLGTIARVPELVARGDTRVSALSPRTFVHQLDRPPRRV